MDLILGFGVGSVVTLCVLAWRCVGQYEPDEDDGFGYEEDTQEDYP